MTTDPRTLLNSSLRDTLLPAAASAAVETQLKDTSKPPVVRSQRLYVCGQAKSHCVNFTLRDVLGPSPDRARCSAVTLLEDCTSSVAGFEAAAQAFVDDMRAMGVHVKTAAETEI